jgi:hypothetical protein
MLVLEVCEDCLFGLINDDFTGVPDELYPIVKEACDKINAPSFVKELGFSKISCECCRSRLHGNRYLIACQS